uniref:Cytochrome c oxidase assembly protein COX20, mitochondrial n=1 Tax=Astyanax mexicanus TaxID=7994 RepID=A0A3B1K2M4_ASTMX
MVSGVCCPSQLNQLISLIFSSSAESVGFRFLKKLYIMLRYAVLHGAGGSVAAGLVHFLATSRVKRSCDVGMAGFVLTTLGSWFYCRYNNAKLRSQQKMIQDGIKNKVMYEGTNLDPTRKPSALLTL